ncbi:uncharacterized, partial [Tachysurus ichikawai]
TFSPCPSVRGYISSHSPIKIIFSSCSVSLDWVMHLTEKRRLRRTAEIQETHTPSCVGNKAQCNQPPNKGKLR